MHVYRWDLDKTYLQTDIHSVRGLLRSAMESAESKRNVPGADVLLRGLLAHDPQARATILSGSPTQMREVLTHKLRLDGIRFDALELKDNLGNLRRGRFRAIRGQLGYKLPRLLTLRASEAVAATESLFGDDAEVDALVYALYADAVAGRVTADEVAHLLRRGGAYDDQIDEARRALARVIVADAVTDIWIHVDRGLPLQSFRVLGPNVHVVFSWLQAALGLWRRGRLSGGQVTEVAQRVGGGGPMASSRRVALVQDAVRRELIERSQLDELLVAEPELMRALPGIEVALDRLGPTIPLAPTSPRDYQAFLHASRSFARTSQEPSTS